MAEKRPLQTNDARWRANIQVAVLLDLLTNHALGLVDLTPTRVKSIEILLKKSLPDVKIVAIDITGGLTVEVLQVASHSPPAKKAPRKKAPRKKAVRANRKTTR